MGWLLPAYKNGKLRITADKICPIHNPEKRKDKPSVPNACREHLWVNKTWFEEWYYKKYGVSPIVREKVKPEEEE